MPVLRLLVVVALLSWAALSARPAAAETTVCTQINSLPTTISAPGHYCLNYNFAADYATAAININSSNVDLDCNGHVVTQVGASAVAGVYANNKNQVTVRNCVLVGFGRGIGFFESAAGQSRNNQLLGNSLRRSKVAGIIMNGSYNVIADNHISENRGAAGYGQTWGILLSSALDTTGVGNVIRNNTITGFAPAVTLTSVFGITLETVTGTVVEGNRISALYAPQNAYAYGLFGSSNAFNTVVVGNHIVSAIGTPPGGGGGLTYGGENIHGAILYAAPTDTTHNVCRDNQVGHWTYDITAEALGNQGCLKMDNLEY
jgi:parallel beta-helix repeat protein